MVCSLGRSGANPGAALRVSKPGSPDLRYAPLRAMLAEMGATSTCPAMKICWPRSLRWLDGSFEIEPYSVDRSRCSREELVCVLDICIRAQRLCTCCGVFQKSTSTTRPHHGIFVLLRLLLFRNRSKHRRLRFECKSVPSHDFEDIAQCTGNPPTDTDYCDKQCALAAPTICRAPLWVTTCSPVPHKARFRATREK